MIAKDDLRAHGVLWGLFAIAFVLRGWGLAAQPPLADEVLVAAGAVDFVREGHLGEVMWYHPPLRNLVVFLSGTIFGGFSAWGLRFGSVLFGSLTVPVLGYLGWGLLGDRRAGYLAALFLGIDPLHIGLSRLAYQESTTPFLIVLGVLATFHAIRTERAWPAYVAGISFGLAAASKWHGLFPWAFCGAAYFLAPRFSGDNRGRQSPVPRLIETIAAFGALPVAVYVGVYLPWLLRGYDLGEFFDFQAWLVQRQYLHRATEDVFLTLSHRAWEWFVRPTAWTEFLVFEGTPRLMVAMGNFLVWVLTLPALAAAALNWFRDRRFGPGFVLGLFLVSYLPLVFTSRGIFVFSAPAVIPFAFLMIGWGLTRVMESGGIARNAVLGYLAAAILISALMYPMARMKTLEYGYLQPVAEMYNPHRGDGAPE